MSQLNEIAKIQAFAEKEVIQTVHFFFKFEKSCLIKRFDLMLNFELKASTDFHLKRLQISLNKEISDKTWPIIVPISTLSEFFDVTK